MNNLQRHIRNLVKWMLAAACLLPALVWGHGAVDTPVARQVKCQKDGGYWSSQDGSSIKDKGCKGAALVFQTPDQWAYQFQQWNEVAHLIKAPGYNDLETVRREVPDGQLCSAGDDKKDGLNRVSADWYRTDVIPKQGKMDVRIIGTAPHVPSFARVFLTKPGFDPTTAPLTWDKLTLIHTEQLTVARQDWGSRPPAISGATGFFEFQVPVPPKQSGKATLFVQWQRIDPAGEGFYNCSDINIVGASIPEEWYELGQFIDPVMSDLKAGDNVHFRVLDNSPEAKEVIDITLPITASNLDANTWGKQLSDRINPAIAKVGEKSGSSIVFNPTQPGANAVYALQKGYSQAMAIVRGEHPGPVNPAPPVARITGPTALGSGQAFTFSGVASSGSNGRLLYEWVVPGMGLPKNEPTVSGHAEQVTQATAFKAILSVRDQQNGKTHEAAFDFTVTPGSGGDYPAYVEGTHYKAGDIVTNNDKNYKCKPAPYTSWCAGAAWAYAPGTGSDWAQAWDTVP
ncbi:lytic polysaccharide monooxygenase [Pseudomonas sp. W4I3]|uniref:lytic polysaccharide monooxygenase n=1 Tax=Pseudomonas sp. W4I3 TaxID=3042294 RepID=UPI00277DEE4C|nr:lytic polysaccharide monooxygenase [Pseudomonas sp. W4I3]MDQ0737257.1 putative carbohydrate-binding protein with CBM5 and CBM33 domain [Pseudomonas sp. W4I3]